MASLWRHRDFRLLWGGETVSEFGSQISILAIALLATKSLHATAFQMGLLGAFETAPFLLVGLPAGAWVDRLRRRPVMISADIGRLLALASVPIAYGLGDLEMTQLFIVAFVAGVLTVFFDVAYQSYLPSLVGNEGLVEGNSKLAVSAQVAAVAGPSIAGGLVQLIGSAAAVAVDAASFGVSAAAVTAIRTTEEQPPSNPHEKLRSQIAEGLQYLLRQPILRLIAATTASFNLFSSMIGAVVVLYLVRVLHLSAGTIGIVFAAAGLGGVLGGLFASRIASAIGSARATMVGAGVGIGALLYPIATASNGAWLFAVGGFITGFGSVLYNVNQVSFRQRLCPPELLGRMNASMRTIVWGIMPIGALLGGWFGTSLGLHTTLWIGAIGESTAVSWLLFSPFARMRDFPEA